MKPRMPRVELPAPYKVEIICDSVGPSGVRFTTFVCTYWRAWHSEMMTHRMLSKSSASSRAIPAKRMRELVRNQSALPIWWGKNEPGMQAREELEDIGEGPRLRRQADQLWADGDRAQSKRFHEMAKGCRSTRAEAQRLWLEGRDAALALHEKLEALGLHKQVCNRILEPWMPITVVISGTDWNNLWHLRDHKDAMPEFQMTATEMFYQYLEHKPLPLIEGEWHQPFIDTETVTEVTWSPEFSMQTRTEEEIENTLNRISAARCARVSYLNHEGKRSIEDDLQLYDRLVRRDDTREPIHAAALEHTAQALATAERIGNVRGWRQLRKTVPYEAGPPEETA